MHRTSRCSLPRTIKSGESIHPRKESINGTSFTIGDCAIAVQWLERDDADPELRTFYEDSDAEVDLD